ncbi:MAG: UbiH/UbiF/VisC/COQ6 family ubiquinone biosynthesis hydroxylase [Gammaproteobacteria bacterium]
MTTASYDIVIAGGGMVGACLACALGNSSLRVAMIEAKPPADLRPEDEVDLRVSAFTHASQRIFAALGAWQGMVERRVSPFREMRVWDATGPGAIHFDSAELAMDTLGWIIENRAVQVALWDRLRAFDNVEVIGGVTVSALAVDADVASVGLSDGRMITAKLVAAADGANSQVRTLAGVGTYGWSYDQKAVVATVQTELPHRETAWQRFLPGGPLAFLPLKDGRCSIVWSTAPDHADELVALEEGDFLAQLQRAFGDVLGRMEHAGPRLALPLRLQHVTAYVKPRLALMGDAAHAIHPLAGQGVNLGLLDAATLAEVLLDARASKRDIGAYHVLRRYERWRKGDNLTMMAAMDGFKRLFGSRVPPVRWVRNLGLGLTDSMPWVKRFIMLYAMGLEGDLPRLARGMGF